MKSTNHRDYAEALFSKTVNIPMDFLKNVLQ
jgi:hypothetical protein